MRRDRIREQPSRNKAGKFATTESLQLLVETSTWFAAWLILPVWLGLTGASPFDFLLYAVGASVLLSLGVAADRPEGFSHPGDVAWLTLLCWLAVLLLGGALFATAGMLH